MLRARGNVVFDIFNYLFVGVLALLCLYPLWDTLMMGSTDAADHAEANLRSRRQTDRGLSAQTFALMPKIRELRTVLAPEDFTPAARPRAAEVHPESSFVHLAGAPMATSKHRLAGLQERSAVLAGAFCNIAEAALLSPLPGPGEPGLDDLLDAAAAAWTARRIIAGEAECLGAGEHDETGYPMHIWV